MKSHFLLLLIPLVSAVTSGYGQTSPLKETSSGWIKYSNNPVLGGKFGTIFDVSVLKQAGGCLMYCSWRPQKSIAVSESKDGLHWKKYSGNPVFKNDPASSWEQAKVTACQVIKDRDEYYMFYIGFKNVDYAQIGMARSKDGIRHWIQNPHNPVIKPGSGWDASAVYKPFAIYDSKQCLLWYNGRKDGTEQIGVALHRGEDLQF